jgi:negative regulator of flagellin synthesis FlgM
MTIDRLNPLDPIQPKKPSGATRVDRNSGNDSVSLSSEAMVKAELFKALELAKSAPEVRMDRVAEVRAKLQDPNYINDSVLNATADRILDQFL